MGRCAAIATGCLLFAVDAAAKGFSSTRGYSRGGRYHGDGSLDLGMLVLFGAVVATVLLLLPWKLPLPRRWSKVQGGSTDLVPFHGGKVLVQRGGDMRVSPGLQQYQRADVSGNDLTVFSFSSPAPELRVLNVRNNDLRSLTGFGNAPVLRWLDVSCNDLKKLGDGCGSCPELLYLDLTDNQLTSGAIGIADFAPRLQVLGAANNDIATLTPDALPTSLRMLDLSSNNLKSVGFLMQLSRLEELSIANNDLRLADVRDDLVAAVTCCERLRVLNLTEAFADDAETAAAVSAVRRARPDLTVLTSWGRSYTHGFNVKFGASSLEWMKGFVTGSGSSHFDGVPALPAAASVSAFLVVGWCCLPSPTVPAEVSVPVQAPAETSTEKSSWVRLVGITFFVAGLIFHLLFRRR